MKAEAEFEADLPDTLTVIAADPLGEQRVGDGAVEEPPPFWSGDVPGFGGAPPAGLLLVGPAPGHPPGETLPAELLDSALRRTP